MRAGVLQPRCPEARHRPTVTPEPRTWLQPHSRREFLLRSSALTAALAATSPSLLAADPPAGGVAPTPPLLLPPLLSRPTETSIRITALNGDQPVEAAVEIRREGAKDWQRRPLPSKVSGREPLDWDVIYQGGNRLRTVLARLGPRATGHHSRKSNRHPRQHRRQNVAHLFRAPGLEVRSVRFLKSTDRMGVIQNMQHRIDDSTFVDLASTPTYG